MWENGVPECQVKAGVGDAERGAEVIREGANGMLCGIAAMDVRGV